MSYSGRIHSFRMHCSKGLGTRASIVAASLALVYSTNSLSQTATQKEVIKRIENTVSLTRNAVGAYGGALEFADAYAKGIELIGAVVSGGPLPPFTEDAYMLARLTALDNEVDAKTVVGFQTLVPASIGIGGMSHREARISIHAAILQAELGFSELAAAKAQIDAYSDMSDLIQQVADRMQLTGQDLLPLVAAYYLPILGRYALLPVDLIFAHSQRVIRAKNRLEDTIRASQSEFVKHQEGLRLLAGYLDTALSVERNRIDTDVQELERQQALLRLAIAEVERLTADLRQAAQKVSQLQQQAADLRYETERLSRARTDKQRDIDDAWLRINETIAQVQRDFRCSQGFTWTTCTAHGNEKENAVNSSSAIRNARENHRTRIAEMNQLGVENSRIYQALTSTHTELINANARRSNIEAALNSQSPKRDALQENIRLLKVTTLIDLVDMANKGDRVALNALRARLK